MTIQDKHITTLLNAKCKIVCAADTILKKMSYGEDVGCCIENLWLAIKLINRLECYKFGVYVSAETTNSVFTGTVSDSTQPTDIRSILKVNGKQVAMLETLAGDNKVESAIDLFNMGDLKFTTESSGGNVIFTITSGCDIETISVTIVEDKIPSETFLTKVTSGVCEYSHYNNCISESKLNKMYEVLNSLLK